MMFCHKIYPILKTPPILLQNITIPLVFCLLFLLGQMPLVAQKVILKNTTKNYPDTAVSLYQVKFKPEVSHFKLLVHEERNDLIHLGYLLEDLCEWPPFTHLHLILQVAIPDSNESVRRDIRKSIQEHLHNLQVCTAVPSLRKVYIWVDKRLYPSTNDSTTRQHTRRYLMAVKATLGKDIQAQLPQTKVYIHLLP